MSRKLRTSGCSMLPVGCDPNSLFIPRPTFSRFGHRLAIEWYSVRRETESLPICTLRIRRPKHRRRYSSMTIWRNLRSAGHRTANLSCTEPRAVEIAVRTYGFCRLPIANRDRICRRSTASLPVASRLTADGLRIDRTNQGKLRYTWPPFPDPGKSREFPELAQLGDIRDGEEMGVSCTTSLRTIT